MCYQKGKLSVYSLSKLYFDMEIRLKFPNFPKSLGRDEQTHFNAYVNILWTIGIIADSIQSPQYCQKPNQPNQIFYKDSLKSRVQVVLET